MGSHSSRAIANEFLRRRGSEVRPQQMLIQKLAYIAHGWNLAINGEPLTAESPEAWDNGPVYRSVWDHIRDFGYWGPACTLADPLSSKPFVADLSPQETAVIDHVWEKYGRMSPARLSSMTHEPDTPWSKAYFGRGRNAPLDDEEIREHYTQLALAGRAQQG